MIETRNTHLQAGCPIFVELDNVQDKFFSRIIGFEEGKYVIISQPTTSNAITPSLTIGSSATIKYVLEGSIIAFQVPVVNQIQNPDQLVFIEFPREVTRQALRAQKRYNCSFPVKFLIGNQTVEAQLEDISLGGCCCSIDNVAVSHLSSPPKVGDSIELTVQEPGTSTWMTLSGRLSNTFGRLDRTHYGIAFERLDRDSEGLIKQLIFQSIPV